MTPKSKYGKKRERKKWKINKRDLTVEQLTQHFFALSAALFELDRNTVAFFLSFFGVFNSFKFEFSTTVTFIGNGHFSGQKKHK